MRATAQDRDASAMMGINVNRTISFTFALGGALAGAAGVIYALYIGTSNFQLGFRLGLFAFTAAVLGGIGNLTGAVLGGVLLGMIAAYNDGFGDAALDDDDHLLDPDPDPRLPPVGPARRADAGRPVVSASSAGDRRRPGRMAPVEPAQRRRSSPPSRSLVVLLYPLLVSTVPVVKFCHDRRARARSSTS